jgi:hypothetical protein
MALKQSYPDLRIEAGVTFELLFRYLLPDANSAINAGDVVTIVFKTHPNAATPLLTKTPTPDELTGEFTLTLTAEETLTLGTQGAWGCEIAASGGEPSARIMQGKYSVEGWDVA